MLPHRRTILIASLTGLAAAGFAREIGVGNTMKLILQTSFLERNGYRFEAPASSDVAPTIFVFSDNKLSYSRIGYHDKALHFKVRVTQECLGDRWTQSGPPHVRVGRGGWPSGGGKPITKPEAVPYDLLVSVPLDQLQLPRGFDPVKRCNTVIQDHTLSGKRPGALLQQGFWIRVNDMVPASLAPGCTYHTSKKGLFDEPPKIAQSVDTRFPVFLRCMPTGYVQTKGAPPRPCRHLW